ncbi:UNVERIFIED_CONTAM: hypothetical protein Sangu_2811600, partial [Sesamum angustifolium]
MKETSKELVMLPPQRTCDEGERGDKSSVLFGQQNSPSVSVDEAHNMSRTGENPGEQVAMRKMENEFMANLVGLRTQDKELFLVATNRPCDPLPQKFFHFQT